jgi:hypothetical protein
MASLQYAGQWGTPGLVPQNTSSSSVRFSASRPELVDADSTKFGRRLQPQAGVGPLGIVVGPPCDQRGLGLGKRGKPMLRETLSPDAPAEGFADRVVDGSAGVDLRPEAEPLRRVGEGPGGWSEG